MHGPVNQLKKISSLFLFRTLSLKNQVASFRLSKNHLTHYSLLTTHNSELKTQNSELR
ncbi:hypothetical protein BH24BAC1_BH24BAC1_03390 [soil metagenome]